MGKKRNYSDKTELYEVNGTFIHITILKMCNFELFKNILNILTNINKMLYYVLLEILHIGGVP